MRAFSKHWIIGLNGELVCGDSDDPFRTWMNELRRTGTVKGDDTKHVPFPERREPRVENSVSDLIERTFGKVRLKPSSGGDEP